MSHHCTGYGLPMYPRHSQVFEPCWISVKGKRLWARRRGRGGVEGREEGKERERKGRREGNRGRRGVGGKEGSEGME